MNVISNATRLVSQVLAGEVWPALADRHGYRVGPDGQPFVLPGMGGVTLGVHCGDPATGYASDHLEPGASVRHRDAGANMALQFLTCVGNPVRVDSGPAAGLVGHVIGQHAYVLVDFAPDVMAGVTTGDQVTVTACGQGLALADSDHRYGRGYRPGYLTIGVISTGQCMLFGHGPGPSTLPGHGPGITPILTGPAGALQAEPDEAGHTGLTEAALQRFTRGEVGSTVTDDNGQEGGEPFSSMSHSQKR
jgi:Domain of unknown function (DUF4438)